MIVKFPNIMEHNFIKGKYQLLVIHTLIIIYQTEILRISAFDECFFLNLHVHPITSDLKNIDVVKLDSWNYDQTCHGVSHNDKNIYGKYSSEWSTYAI